MQGMETPSRVREPDGYIPPALDAEHRRYWPPSTRALAIKWARRAGLQEEGLAVDDATLKRVADAVMDAAHPPAPFTLEVRDEVLPGSLWNCRPGRSDPPSGGGRGGRFRFP
jgi:hypothetical protein